MQKVKLDFSEAKTTQKLLPELKRLPRSMAIKSDDSIGQEEESTTQPAEEPTNIKGPSIWLSKRFLVVILLLLGCFVYSMMCYVVNIAIVDMITPKPLDKSHNTNNTRPAEFQWDSITVGMILNMFFYGALFSPIGGMLSQKFGGATTLGVSLAITGILTLFTPITLRANFNLFLVSRGVIGIFEGFAGATVMEVLRRWVPPAERPLFMSLVINGFYAGAAVTYPFCGYIAYEWGWPMTFYATGIICISWSLLWLALVKNEPSKDKWISKGELLYITEKMVSSAPSKKSLPYIDILTSGPFWALCLAKFAYSWGFTFIIGYFPLYIKDITQNDVKKIGLISSIPQFFNIAIIPIAGIVIGFWESHTRLRITLVHKIIIGGGLTLCALLFVIIALVDNFTVLIIGFITILVLLSCNKIVAGLITINIAPNHVSIIAGLSLFWQTFGFIFTQTFIGFVVKDHKPEEWDLCYRISTGAMLFCAVIFMLCGSSEPQQWSVRHSQDTNQTETATA